MGERKQRLEAALKPLTLAPVLWVEDEPPGDSFYQFDPQQWESKIDFAYAENEHYQMLRQARPLRRSEISVAYKHWKCFEDMVEQGIEVALILEDDVILCEDFQAKLLEGLEKTPADWDAIFPGSGSGLHIANPVPGQVAYGREHPAARCADTYLIRQSIAYELYQRLQRIHLPLDFELSWVFKFCQSKVYWWEPPLTAQGSQHGLYTSSVQTTEESVPSGAANPSEEPKRPAGEPVGNHCRTALFFLSAREIYRDRLVSESEIFFSPDCQTQLTPGHPLSVQSRPEPTDVNAYFGPLLGQWQPELIVVKADATGRAWPLNLRSQSVPKVLIVGDTHHLTRPIQSLLGYAEQEQFDVIVSEHDRHHLHYFAEMGHPRCIWIPGFATNPHHREPKMSYQYPLVFVGSAGPFHPYRRYLLEKIQRQGFPLLHTQAPQAQAADLYNNSLISLNISLNGDLNLRVFEVLAAGGFLLTDRLTPESGLPMLFEDGKHLVTFDGEADLYDKLRYYLDHPQEAKAIARAGYEHYWANYRPDLNIQRLLHFLNTGTIEAQYRVTADRRAVV
ncbi:MAG: glycosyltransferase [Cyanobacteria bacterium P01_H01_bin.130]